MDEIYEENSIKCILVDFFAKELHLKNSTYKTILEFLRWFHVFMWNHKVFSCAKFSFWKQMVDASRIISTNVDVFVATAASVNIETLLFLCCERVLHMTLWLSTVIRWLVPSVFDQRRSIKKKNFDTCMRNFRHKRCNSCHSTRRWKTNLLDATPGLYKRCINVTVYAVVTGNAISFWCRLLLHDLSLKNLLETKQMTKPRVNNNKQHRQKSNEKKREKKRCVRLCTHIRTMCT